MRTLICVLVLVNIVLTYVAWQSLFGRLKRLQDDVSAIRIRFVPPNFGGRPVPTPADFAAARIRDLSVTPGQNRVDTSGTAQSGPSG